MENRHFGKILGLLSLLFLSSFGGSSEAMFRVGMDYDSATGYAFITAFLTVCGASIVMMLIPLICKLIRKKKLPYKSGKLVCLFNSIIMFFLLAILEFQLVGGLGAIAFYFINKWIFVEDPMNPDAKTNHADATQADKNNPDSSQPLDKPKLSLSSSGEECKKYGSYAVYGNEISLTISSNSFEGADATKENARRDEEIVELSAQYRNQSLRTHDQFAPTFCHKCGSRLNQGAVFCGNCGTKIPTNQKGNN